MSCWALLALSLLLPCLPHPSDVSTLFIFDPVDDPVDDPFNPQVFHPAELAQGFSTLFSPFTQSPLLLGLVLDHKSSNYIRLSFSLKDPIM